MALFSQPQMEILALFLAHPEEDLSYREIGEMVGKPPGSFQRSITCLRDEGLLASSTRGNQRYFRLNPNHFLLPDVESIIRKTVGCEALLRKAVEACPAVAVAYLYGSYAQKRLRIDSDIDLLVVLDGAEIPDVLLGEIVKIEKALGRAINYRSFDADEYRRRIVEGDPFLVSVRSSDIIRLKGEP